MKSIKYLLVCLLAFYSSCADDEPPFFVLSHDRIEFDWQESSKDILLHTNVDVEWETKLPNWLSVFVLQKQDIDITLRINVDENDSENVRFHEMSFLGQSSRLYITQSVRERLRILGRKEFIVEPFDTILNIPIDKNVDYEISFLNGSQNWITLYRDGVDASVGKGENPKFEGKNKLSLSVSDNYGDVRNAEIVIYNRIFSLSDTLSITQKGCTDEYNDDGEVFLLQKGKTEKTNLIILGDGFVKRNLGKGGDYEKSLNKAIEHFFSVEPYQTYREYFNVYMVIAESEEKGVGNKKPFGGNTIKNKFGTAFGDGTEIVCNDELIFEYARKVKELPKDKPITVLVVLNSDKYAGTAYLYPDGNSIALCPMSTAEPPNDFEGIVHHEAGGHAFGFLLDEYVYNQSEMPESRKKEIQEWQKQGYQMNLDFTDDLDKILWKDFIGIDKYSPVGAYEGGYEYQFGVWRSEENSCMNNNIPYYNVQSRWAIVKRIMELSDVEFSVQDFIADDNPVYPTDSRALNTWEDFVPLGTPIWVMR